MITGTNATLLKLLKEYRARSKSFFFQSHDELIRHPFVEKKRERERKRGKEGFQSIRNLVNMKTEELSSSSSSSLSSTEVLSSSSIIRRVKKDKEEKKKEMMIIKTSMTKKMINGFDSLRTSSMRIIVLMMNMTVQIVIMIMIMTPLSRQTK